MRNAITEKLNTVRLECPCGCEIHIEREIINGNVVSEKPILEYYGINGNDYNFHYQTIKCDRHSNLSLEDLHYSLAEEGKRLAKAKEIMLENLPEEKKIIYIDPETNDQSIFIKGGVTYTFDNDNTLLIKYDIDEETKQQIKENWNILIGLNKVSWLVN